LWERERVQEYVSKFQWDYDYSTIELLKDGSRPQPLLPVSDGLQCRICPFKSSSGKGMKVHGNEAYGQKRVDDDELFKMVRLHHGFRIIDSGIG
jgi:hypothetical protein